MLMNDMKLEITIEEIERNLRRLGIARHYKGFSRFAYAVYLVIQDESRLEAVVKEVYIPVAEFFGCSWTAVERSLRSVCACVWGEQCNKIYEETGIKFKRHPIPSELLDIVSMYVKDKHAVPQSAHE